MNKLILTDIIKSQPYILQDHLSLCIDFLISRVDGIISIILTGGYGRSEGTWIKNKESYQPYNDYDFVIILDDNQKRKNSNSLQLDTSELASSLGINWVDVDFLYTKDLKNLRCTIKNFDTLYGSTVIYGDTKILEIAPKLSVSKISTKDFYTYFYTRAYTVLCCLPKDKKLSDLNNNEMQFFRNQLAKGFLAIMDCILISKYKFYCSSYIERTKYYSNISENNEKVSFFEWALKEKIDPCSNSFDINFGLQAHEKLFELYQTDMNKFLGEYFYGANLTLNNFRLFELTRLTQSIKFILSKVSVRYNNFYLERALNNLQYILIMAWNANGDMKNYEKNLPTINKIISQIDPSSDINLPWSSAVELIRNSR